MKSAALAASSASIVKLMQVQVMFFLRVHCDEAGAPLKLSQLAAAATHHGRGEKHPRHLPPFSSRGTVAPRIVTDTMKKWRWILCGMLWVASLLSGKADDSPTQAARSAQEPVRGKQGGFQFDGTISRQVLEDYLARSMTMEGLLNGRGDLQDNIRMLKIVGAKYIGRALCLWGAEANFVPNIARAKEDIPRVLAADPEMILEACVFETVSPRVNNIAIPDWVFSAFDEAAESRNFRYDEMIYPEGQRRPMGRNAQVPDESRLETRLWFYYQAASYIDIGCEAIHFGQVEIMNKNDRDNAHWERLLTLVRAARPSMPAVTWCFAMATFLRAA